MEWCFRGVCHRIDRHITYGGGCAHTCERLGFAVLGLPVIVSWPTAIVGFIRVVIPILSLTFKNPLPILFKQRR